MALPRVGRQHIAQAVASKRFALSPARTNLIPDASGRRQRKPSIVIGKAVVPVSWQDMKAWLVLVATGT